MTMTKLLLLLAFCSALAACGQKGPLIVDRPIDEEGQEQVDGELISNDGSEDSTGSRLDRQLEGSSTIINR